MPPTCNPRALLRNVRRAYRRHPVLVKTSVQLGFFGAAMLTLPFQAFYGALASDPYAQAAFVCSAATALLGYRALKQRPLWGPAPLARRVLMEIARTYAPAVALTIARLWLEAAAIGEFDLVFALKACLAGLFTVYVVALPLVLVEAVLLAWRLRL